jgi:four helix bundle protein
MSDGKPFEIRQRCYQFSKDVITLIKNEKVGRLHLSIIDQLIRSATSVGANVVEGRAGSSKRDFKNYYRIALKSANETKYWICLIRDTDILKVEKETLNKLLKEADELSKIIASIIINMEK